MKKRYLSITVVASKNGEQSFFTKSVNMDHIFGDPDQQMAEINRQMSDYFNELKRGGYNIDYFHYHVIDFKDNRIIQQSE